MTETMQNTNTSQPNSTFELNGNPDTRKPYDHTNEYGHNIKFQFTARRTQCLRCGSRRAFSRIKCTRYAGKCFSCGVFIPPGKDDTQPFYPPTKSLPKFDHMSRPPSPTKYVDEAIVARSLDYLTGLDRQCTGTEESQRDQFLGRLERAFPFGAELIRLTRPSILKDWSVGRSVDGGAIYWYRESSEGKACTSKIVHYEGFRRVKNDLSRQTRCEYTSMQGYMTQTLFGMHQLAPGFTNYRGETYSCENMVILVESEKTAIIMSHHLPQFVWLAAGGSQSLNHEKVRQLKGRKVRILFDNDRAGETGAHRTFEIMRDVVEDVAIYHPKDICATASDGWDLADLAFEVLNI